MIIKSPDGCLKESYSASKSPDECQKGNAEIVFGLKYMEISDSLTRVQMYAKKNDLTLSGTPDQKNVCYPEIEHRTSCQQDRRQSSTLWAIETELVWMYS